MELYLINYQQGHIYDAQKQQRMQLSELKHLSELVCDYLH